MCQLNTHYDRCLIENVKKYFNSEKCACEIFTNEVLSF